MWRIVIQKFQRLSIIFTLWLTVIIFAWIWQVSNGHMFTPVWLYVGHGWTLLKCRDFPIRDKELICRHKTVSANIQTPFIMLIDVQLSFKLITKHICVWQQLFSKFSTKAVHLTKTISNEIKKKWFMVLWRTHLHSLRLHNNWRIVSQGNAFNISVWYRIILWL